MTSRKLIAGAAAAFHRRDFATAERGCHAVLGADPTNAEATHLLGLVRSALGDSGGAETLLRASVDLAPRRAEFRVNLGKLLSAGDRLGEAEVELRGALEAEPGSRLARLALARLLSRAGSHALAAAEARILTERDGRDAEAWAVLAGAQQAQGQLAEAEGSYRHALAARPEYAVARHNLGALLGQLSRAEESLAELERAARLGLEGAALELNRARALIDLGRYADAEAVLATTVEERPESLAGHVLLAKLRYMRGDDRFARDLSAMAASASDDPAPSLALGDLLRRAGDLEGAEQVLRAVAARHEALPQVASSLAVVLQELGDLERAVRYARAAAAARPEDPDVVENLTAILLQSGTAEECRPLIARERERTPLDGRWLAYEATAARLLGDPRYGELYDYQRFVGVFDLEPPPGFASAEEFNAALAARLTERHTLKAHPLDQSLRHGTQVSRLLGDSDPLLQSFFATLAAPIESYCTQIGFAAGHPFLGRNRGAAVLTGCWSVRLRQGGYHVNHIHPQGWISSAYYVALPAGIDAAQGKSGWIKFGEPRMPTPGAGPAHFVEPRVSRLVLFPSYMWHGTEPLTGDEPRLTIAFDALPRTEPSRSAP